MLPPLAESSRSTTGPVVGVSVGSAVTVGAGVSVGANVGVEVATRCATPSLRRFACRISGELSAATTRQTRTPPTKLAMRRRLFCIGLVPAQHTCTAHVMVAYTRNELAINARHGGSKATQRTPLHHRAAPTSCCS